MNNKRSSSTSARQLFLDDIRDTEKYLAQMQESVREICDKQNLNYPHTGRGYKGMLPNIPYAVHFRLKGYSPKDAAENYIQLEIGRSVRPLEPVGVGAA